ncbi:hypothetical protein N9A94_04290 [Akkermansiaceae bacterium]|nr:hypothetical protein [Akkermansiaceae bacterium]MDA7888778.1 hypothetical protein [Akkermansiaceae bacterium]MDB4537160.1 hypothetical protein [Akkermansiaceae bacterium]
MEFDYFDFDGVLVEDLFSLLGPKVEALKAAVDPRCPEEFSGFETMEHIHGVAVVAAQRYISTTCAWLHLDRVKAFDLGAKVGTTTKIAAIHAAANYWKHADDGLTQIQPRTRATLEAAGVNFDESGPDETTYLVGNVLHRCAYSNLGDLLDDLKSWTELAIATEKQ